MKKRILILLYIGVLTIGLHAQQYIGSAGLIHVPTAEMDTAGVARIGAHFIPKEMMPNKMKLDGEKFDSWTNYLSITPFRWIQIGYGYTLWKFHKNLEPSREVGFYAKDRYFSLRLQPIQEDEWWPSVLVGGNDVWGSLDDGESGSNFYRNYYCALTKHFDLFNMLSLGTHVSYRKWKLESNQKWDGVVGGLTLSPHFLPELRLIGEYDGDNINFGADCTVYRYFQIQAAIIGGKYFTGGLSLLIPLL